MSVISQGAFVKVVEEPIGYDQLQMTVDLVSGAVSASTVL